MIRKKGVSAANKDKKNVASLHSLKMMFAVGRRKSWGELRRIENEEASEAGTSSLALLKNCTHKMSHKAQRLGTVIRRDAEY